MSNAAIILAAGRGERIQHFTPDKVLTPLAGRPAILFSVEAFLESDCAETMVIVFRDDTQRTALESALSSAKASAALARRLPDFLWVKGGDERKDSVLSGLKALPEEPGLVFIHDAARPLVSPAAIRLLARKAAATGAACLARRITDTIKQVRPATDLSLDACVLQTLDRSCLWAMETPQVFDRPLILAAYEKVQAAGILITDDTAAIEELGHPVSLVENDSPNPKLTVSADAAYIEYLLKSRTEALQ